ncbi:N-6 DNA methylase [Desulfovibrio sp.]|uniref:N-6 DNA methylase n=1 Tax=Desulfovibrio sp. TaxID=885 RepID=UPI0025BB5461|nr:N-6 DNA methylase [Desulfovibrio sp.]
MTQHIAPHDVMSARARFPAGLEQPEGSLRFGADALLLAAFVARHVEAKKHRHVADSSPVPFSGLPSGPAHVPVAELGSGCGAALLALALRCPQVAGLGLEREEPLVQAARRNADLLGLSGQAGQAGLPDVSDLPDSADLAEQADLSGVAGPAVPSGQTRFAVLDLADRPALAALAAPAPPQVRTSPAGEKRLAGNQHIVMANPPYDTGGRPSPRAMRERALRGNGNAAGGEKILDTFCRAAAMLLRHQGYFFCIHDARALPQLCAALQAARFGIRRILPVHARSGGPALRVLVASRKNAAHDAALEAPLYLHGDSSDGRPLWTAEALRFCPWLSRNDSGDSALFTAS